MGPAELVQAIDVARQYFIQDRTKVQIANDLGISRYKVARILVAAREAGIVRIEIGAPSLIDHALSEELRRFLGLTHCLVVDLPGEQLTEEGIRDAIGAAAASLLAEIVTPDDTLGIAWGRSVSSMAYALTTLDRCDVVQMTGVAGDLGHTSVDILRKVAGVSGGRAYPIFAPLVVGNAATATSLMTHPAIAEATSQFSRITKATVAVGSWNAEGSQLYASLSPSELGKLRGAPIVAEVCAMLLDDAGNLIRSTLDARTIAIDYNQLRAIPEVIAVAAGVRKARAIRSVIRSGIARSLVTDSVVARALLSSEAAD